MSVNRHPGPLDGPADFLSRRDRGFGQHKLIVNDTSALSQEVRRNHAEREIDLLTSDLGRLSDFWGAWRMGCFNGSPPDRSGRDKKCRFRNRPQRKPAEAERP